jgi:hypothetical protein
MTKKKKDNKKSLETTRVVLGREVKVYEGTASGALRSEIKGNETRKDYNTLIDLAIMIVGVKSVFGY